MTALLRLGARERFTANRLIGLDVLGAAFLVKFMPNTEEARNEVCGHRALRGHLPVPRLYGALRMPRGTVLIYERIGCGQPDEGLLLDLLNMADDPAEGDAGLRVLDAYLDQMTTAYREAILMTARPLRSIDAVRKLYWDRAAPGGRLDKYYEGRDFAVADGLIDVRISELAAYTLVVNGREFRLDWTKTLRWLRDWSEEQAESWCAITQGDPTDVNLAVPFAVLDFDAAGFNSIAGEFANFCWYTARLGGYLVPRQNPNAFARHRNTFRHVHRNAPELQQLEVDESSRRIYVELRWRTAPARRRAVESYFTAVVEPVRAVLFGGRLDDVIRPFLALRILGVYNVADLEPIDRLCMIASLARCISPDFRFREFFDQEES